MRGLITLALAVAAWWGASRTGAIAPLYLPDPADVIHAMRMKLLTDAAATMGRCIVGYSFGILVGYFIHGLSVITRTAQSLDAQFAASRAIPAVALMPLFILWFGFGETGRVLIVTLTSAAFFLAPLHNAFQVLPREWTILSDRMILRPIRFYFLVILPGTLGSLLGALRLNMAICFTISIASDYMGAQYGIGKFIDTARITFNVPGMFLAVLVACALGLVLDKLVVASYVRFVHWTGRTIKA